MDQTLANIQTLYTLHEELYLAGVTLYLMTEDSLVLYLDRVSYVDRYLLYLESP